MAVFMINICKYDDCGITFPILEDLIEHIESNHIANDPLILEQKEASHPSCIAMSYVLRFYTEGARREIQNSQADARRRLLPAPKAPSVQSNTSTGSEPDEEELMSPSEDSNDSWTTVEEYSSEYILRNVTRIQNTKFKVSSAHGGVAVEKPFACPVPGCKKRYKNVNGIKYHSKNGHKKDGKVKKAYKCHCGKNYKTAQGLKSHSISVHIAIGHPLPPPPTTCTAISNSYDDHISKPIHVSRSMQNLTVTSAQPLTARPLTIDPIDGNKLMSLYDSIKTIDKTFNSFSIQKPSYSNVTILKGHVDYGHSTSKFGVLTSTPGVIGKYTKDNKSTKVTVQSNPTHSPTIQTYANEKIYNSIDMSKNN